MGRSVIAAIALAVLVVLAPARVAAQEAHDERVTTATALAGVSGALATWPLLMPWEGFWHDRPDPTNGWAITGALAAGGLLSLATWGLAQGHPERAEILATTSIVSFAGGVGIAAYGMLGTLLVDFDRLATALVFGVPALAGLVSGLLVASVHAAIEGDRPPTEPTPMVVIVPLPISL